MRDGIESGRVRGDFRQLLVADRHSLPERSADVADTTGSSIPMSGVCRPNVVEDVVLPERGSLHGRHRGCRQMEQGSQDSRLHDHEEVAWATMRRVQEMLEMKYPRPVRAVDM